MLVDLRYLHITCIRQEETCVVHMLQSGRNYHSLLLQPEGRRDESDPCCSELCRPIPSPWPFTYFWSTLCCVFPSVQCYEDCSFKSQTGTWVAKSNVSKRFSQHSYINTTDG